MKTKYIQISFIISFFFFFSFSSIYADYYIDEGLNGSISYEGSSYYNGPEDEKWEVFLGDGDNYMAITYNIDIFSGGCEQVKIRAVDQNYDEYVLKVITSSKEGVVYTTFPTRYIVVEFERYCQNSGVYPNGIWIEYEGYSEIQEDWDVDSGLKVEQLSINTNYSDAELTMEGYGIIKGRIAIGDDDDAYRQGHYLNNFNVSDDLLGVYGNAAIFGNGYFDGSYYISSFDANNASIYNLGIGITSPSVPFQVTNYSTRNKKKLSAVLGNAADHWTLFGGLTGGQISGSNTGSLTLEGNSAGTGDKNIYLNPTTNSNIIMNQGGGKVGIGVVPTVELDVKGVIRAHEVKVCLNQGCDFVFEPDYKLMSLSDLDQFVTKNKHLPEVEPAAVMESEGIDVSEMNALLLQKIEELTLYMIAQNKETMELRNKTELLEEKIRQLEADK